jgi:hypothetical protein
MKINIEVIPHKEHRYETVGDWWLDAEGVLQVRVSKMSDSRYSALVVIHELAEVLIESVKRTGQLVVPQSLVDETDKFDKAYEAAREPDNEEGEPGCEPTCPVYQGHMAASAIENIAAMLLGINYNEYADEIASL